MTRTTCCWSAGPDSRVYRRRQGHRPRDPPSLIPLRAAKLCFLPVNSAFKHLFSSANPNDSALSALICMSRAAFDRILLAANPRFRREPPQLYADRQFHNRAALQQGAHYPIMQSGVALNGVAGPSSFKRVPAAAQRPTPCAPHGALSTPWFARTQHNWYTHKPHWVCVAPPCAMA